MPLSYGILSLTSISSKPVMTAAVTPVDEVPVVKADGNGLGSVVIDWSGEESEEYLKAVIRGVSVCVEFVLYYSLLDVIDNYRLHFDEPIVLFRDGNCNAGAFQRTTFQYVLHDLGMIAAT
jgi:hypothetical protein